MRIGCVTNSDSSESREYVEFTSQTYESGGDETSIYLARRACGLHIQRINQICEDNYVVPGGDVRELIISNSLQTAIVDN